MGEKQDRGSLFISNQLMERSFRSIPFRRRSATYPSASSRHDSLLDNTELDDNSSYGSHNSISGLDVNNVFGTPESETNFQRSLVVLNRERYLTSIDESVTENFSKISVNDSSTPCKPNCTYNDNYNSSPNRNGNINSSYYENSPHSSPMRSVIPNYGSPLVQQVIHYPLANIKNPYQDYRALNGYNNVFHFYNNALIDGNNNHWHSNHFSIDKVEELARSHRNAATHADPRHTWSGILPTNNSNKTPVYSCKVFLGGVPWDMTDHDIKLTFSRFGVINVLRPGKDVRLSRNSQDRDKAGYLYLILDSDKQVKALLNACTHDFSNGGKYYYALNQQRFRPKDVQVIPWNIHDSTYTKNQSARVDISRTVFVGALHGMLTAEGLCTVLEDLFGPIVYVGIDTDKYKYPIGSGRVTFGTQKAYAKAVQAAFIDVKSSRFNKKIQIDPFLEDMPCSNCHNNKGPIFCRDACMRYLCRMCWDLLHVSEGMKRHQPMMRNKNHKTIN